MPFPPSQWLAPNSSQAMATNSLSKVIFVPLPLSVPTSPWNSKLTFFPGIAYQLVEDDPLVNTTQCQLDSALMKELGANAIRVYHVDATANHDGCMAAFADAGIYLFVDADSFKTYIRLVRELVVIGSRQSLISAGGRHILDSG